MPYRMLQRIEDEAQAKELGQAIQLAQHELASSRYCVLVDKRGLAYVTAIVQDVIDRCCPHRGYRVTARYVPGPQINTWLDLEEPYDSP